MTINWGIIGTAGIASQEMIPAMKSSTQSKLLGIASRDEQKARNWAERYGAPKYFGSYEDLLVDSDIQAVYIPLPNHLHHPWTTAAAQEGKHILCEKPLGLSPDQVQDMFSVARDNDVQLMEGFMYRFHPQTERAKELVAQGGIGSPILFRGSHSFPLVAEDRKDDFRWNPEYGGGSLYDVGTYSVNTARYLFDEEPREVAANMDFHPDYEAEAQTQALMRFADRKTAVFDSSFLLTHRADYEVITTRGRIRALNAYDSEEKPLKLEVIQDGSQRLETFPRIDEYRLELEAFMEAIKEDKHSPLSEQDSINQARVLKAVKQSASNHEWVQVERM